MTMRAPPEMVSSVALLFAVLAVAPNVQAGASNTALDCKSADQKKRLRLTGEVPGDFYEFSLKLEVSGQFMLMSMEKDKIAVVTELSKGVFTMAVARPGGQTLRLYAIPATVKLKGGSRRLFNATFEALLIEAPKPGPVDPRTGASTLADVKLVCSLRHEV